MSVLAVGGAVVGAAGTAYAANKSAKAAKDARRAAQLQPMAVNTPFGNASIDKGRLEVQDAPGTKLAPQFEGIAGQGLGQAQNALGQLAPGLNIDPTAFFSAASQVGGPTAQAFGGMGQNFLGAGQQLLQSIGSFDADAFAQDRFQALNQLAAPGEERAAGSLANRLFSRGRLGGGDTTAGRAFGDLEQAQQRALTERGIMSQQAASQELMQRIQQSGALSQFGGQTAMQGQNIAGLEQQRFLNALQGGGVAQGLNMQNIQGLLGLGISGTQGIQEAFAPSRSAIQTLLGASEIQQGGSATAAQAIMQGGTAQANLIGNAAAGLGQGLMSFAASRNPKPDATK